MTLAEMRGENAFTILANIGKLLRQFDREAGTSLEDEYQAEAMSGDYDHLCAVTERYALDYLRQTLSAEEGDLTGDEVNAARRAVQFAERELRRAEAGVEEHDEEQDEECDHCGTVTTPRQERECDDCTRRLNGVS